MGAGEEDGDKGRSRPGRAGVRSSAAQPPWPLEPTAEICAHSLWSRGSPCAPLGPVLLLTSAKCRVSTNQGPSGMGWPKPYAALTARWDALPLSKPAGSPHIGTRAVLRPSISLVSDSMETGSPEGFDETETARTRPQAPSHAASSWPIHGAVLAAPLSKSEARRRALPGRERLQRV